jgi:cation diffusion facilitator family transporter
MTFSKKKASTLFLYVVMGLILLKGMVSWITSSLSILAQAADSVLDLLSGFIILLAVRVADKTEDQEHPYGHHKLEDFAGLIQGILIGATGIGIIYSSVRRIMSGAGMQEPEAGIAVMIVSIATSLWLSRYLKKASVDTRSMALEAAGNNIRADVYSASGVLAGLLILRLTGLTIIDPILAILVAFYMLKIGFDTVYKPFSKLIDSRLSEEEEQIITEVILKHKDEVAGYHRLRTRQAGDKRHIDLHVLMPKAMSLETCHGICDQIEADIEERLPGSSTVIHAEPCDGECKKCPLSCDDS